MKISQLEDHFSYKEKYMKNKQSVGEGGAVIILLAITFLIIGIVRFYKSAIKPCGWFNEREIISNEIPSRCLEVE